MRAHSTLLAFALTSTLVACVVPTDATDATDAGGDGGTSTPSSDVATICSKIAACNVSDPTTGVPYTVATCEAAFNGWLPALNCAADMTAATCDDVIGKGDNSSTLNGVCFPACTMQTNASCAGDDFTLCNSVGQQLTFACTGVCAQQSKQYAGVCGATNGTDTSPSGEAICWCQ